MCMQAVINQIKTFCARHFTLSVMMYNSNLLAKPQIINYDLTTMNTEKEKTLELYQSNIKKQRFLTIILYYILQFQVSVQYIIKIYM